MSSGLKRINTGEAVDGDESLVAGAASRRLMGVDVARAVAVLGMIVVHTGALVVNPTVTWAFSGRSAILFAVLAGLSLGLLSGGSRVHTGVRLRMDRRNIAMRGCLLLILGLLLAVVPSSVMVILVTYAVLFWIALPALSWTWRRLATVAAVWAVAAPVVSFVVRASVLPETNTIGGVASPFDLFSVDGWVAAVRMTFIDGTYPVLSWVPFVLMGLAIARWGVGRRTAGWTMSAVGIVLAMVGYGASWIAMNIFGLRRVLIAEFDAIPDLSGSEMYEFFTQNGFFGTVPTSHWAWLFTAAPHSGTPFEIIGSGGVALVVVGLALLLARSIPVLLIPLASLGRMPLTVYAGHIVVLGVLYLTDLLTLSTWQFTLFLVVPVVAATLWFRFFDQGPLEKLLSFTTNKFAQRLVT
ncbi:DUF418 domain-containing protein [Hoyosella rhizosphaerae]|uniref:DUF418 domain-containing protein n=1 Tax=Hoyosella rhizosphaerae TaxID=1755582 RepID=A0A916U8P4_9ACTN|nr:DUF418 domain-containing protein [Hoyosella rhizosphaerae]MBN4927507.1 DUF418 domain-containing protein [Hoyosella rhizosphaerae]GGC63948.1 hypothetical protein GCM10011410_15490 [Hoyosella rhizosphaerae]